MNKERLQEILLHPLFISLIIWGAVLIFIPPVFQKYRVKKIKTEYTGPKVKYFFSDVDNDGTTERFSVDLNDNDQTKIIITRNRRVIEQYNFKYQAVGRYDLFTGDYNNDGYKECFIFTRSSDSIFLSVFEPVRLRKTLIYNRFISSYKISRQSDNRPYIRPVLLDKRIADGYCDFVFYINGGYALTRRSVYRYSIDRDTLINSPLSTANIMACLPYDINGDKLNEFILNTNASDNYDSTAVFSDHYSWLMVLNNALDFQFKPVRFDGYPSRVRILPRKIKKETRLLLFFDFYGTGNIKSAFDLFDVRGGKILEKSVDDYESPYASILPNESAGENTFFFVKNRSGDVEELDSDLNILQEFTIPAVESCDPLSTIDADLDGKTEYFFLGTGAKHMVITRSDLKNPVLIDIEGVEYLEGISTIAEQDNASNLYIQLQEMGVFLKYSENPFYFLKYPLYLALYLLIFAFVTAIYRIQEYRLNLKLQTEKRIASLQMKAIKNQIDPHFTLNILNAIGSLYSTVTDKEKADYIFSKYARLIRQTVISSDQVVITLAEELDFIKNYIDLERFRSNNFFSVDITTGKEVDTSVKVPRMLIHTFVENAIKYGVRKRDSGGILTILSRVADKKILVTIEDNGPGLHRSENNVQGTGKGLSIVDEMIELYFRLERARITYTLQTINKDDGATGGTRAVIEIPCNPSRSV